MEKDETINKAMAKRDIAVTLLSLTNDGYIESEGDHVYRTTCPKCGSKEMKANTEIQMCRCGNCGLSGNVLDIVRSAYGTSVSLAADFLNSDFLDATQVPHKELNELLEINKDAARFFFSRLRHKDKHAQKAMAYLTEKRKLSKAVLKDFGIGYAGPDNRELYKYLKGKYPEDLIKRSGLICYGDKGPYDRFRNRVIFPIMNIAGNVIGFGGRVMGDEVPKYLNSPESEIFIKGQNLYGITSAARAGKRVMFVCEGYMDTIALQAAGYKHAVASLGTALTEHHVYTIRRYAEVAYFLYDSDEPGIKAALRGIELSNEAGLKVKTVSLSPYKDPDEFLKAEGKEAFEERLRNALPSEKFVEKHKEYLKKK